MKSLIIYQSVHHQNTQKIAEVMAKTLEARINKPSEIRTEELSNYDLIGFGSGIYFWQHHRNLISFIKKLPKFENKKAFIFSTSGLRLGKKILHLPLKELLSKKGFMVVGQFNCPGFDTFGPFKLFGGFNRNRPNEKDLEKAKQFAKKLI